MSTLLYSVTQTVEQYRRKNSKLKEFPSISFNVRVFLCFLLLVRLAIRSIEYDEIWLFAHKWFAIYWIIDSNIDASYCEQQNATQSYIPKRNWFFFCWKWYSMSFFARIIAMTSTGQRAKLSSFVSSLQQTHWIVVSLFSPSSLAITKTTERIEKKNSIDGS